jgi:hypothetical protein
MLFQVARSILSLRGSFLFETNAKSLSLSTIRLARKSVFGNSLGTRKY